jgi:hypothetical protein
MGFTRALSCFSDNPQQKPSRTSNHHLNETTLTEVQQSLYLKHLKKAIVLEYGLQTLQTKN